MRRAGVLYRAGPKEAFRAWAGWPVGLGGVSFCSFYRTFVQFDELGIFVHYIVHLFYL